MSSRRLLILLRFLDDESPFKQAYFADFPEQYDWPRDHQLSTLTLNEIKAMRGDLWAYLGNERLTYKPVLSPSAQREVDEKRQAMRAGHDSIIAQLGGEN
jgi:hypothetical protein